MSRQSYKREATDVELKLFLTSPLYRDFLSIMELRCEAIRDDLCTATSMENVSRLQGELRGVQFWKSFPEELAKSILQEREDVEGT